MSLKLMRVGAGVWTGKVGEEFEVDVKPAPGGGPFLIHTVSYGEVSLHEPPFKFEVIEGDKGLSTVYDWDQEGEWVFLNEVSGADSQTLRKRLYKEQEPFQSILIQGRS